MPCSTPTWHSPGTTGTNIRTSRSAKSLSMSLRQINIPHPLTLLRYNYSAAPGQILLLRSLWILFFKMLTMSNTLVALGLLGQLFVPAVTCSSVPTQAQVIDQRIFNVLNTTHPPTEFNAKSVRDSRRQNNSALMLLMTAFCSSGSHGTRSHPAPIPRVR